MLKGIKRIIQESNGGTNHRDYMFYTRILVLSSNAVFVLIYDFTLGLLRCIIRKNKKDRGKEKNKLKNRAEDAEGVRK